VQEYTTKFKKQAIVLGISPKNQDVVLNYLGGLHNHLRRQVMLFKPRKIDEASMQARYLENVDKKKGQPSGCKHKYHQDDYKEEKKKWKGKYKKKTTMAHE